jgi:Alpha/beta hydrolase domain
VFAGTVSSYRRLGDTRQQADTDKRAMSTTRLIVRRLTVPSSFSGNVVVEWLNVTAGGRAPVWNVWHTKHIW